MKEEPQVGCLTLLQVPSGVLYMAENPEQG